MLVFIKKFLMFYLYLFFWFLMILNAVYIHEQLKLDVISKSDQKENKKLWKEIKSKDARSNIFVSLFLIVGSLISINAIVIIQGYSYTFNFKLILIATITFYFYYFSRMYLNIKQ